MLELNRGIIIIGEHSLIVPRGLTACNNEVMKSVTGRRGRTDGIVNIHELKCLYCNYTAKVFFYTI